MADLSFYINNVLVNPPESWQNLEIELDFTNNNADANIKTTTFTWLGSNAEILNQWFTQGLFGGLGIFEGIPFRIEICEGLTCFDGVIDMTNQDTTFQCDIVKAAVIETNRIQFLNDRAESFTFAYLSSIGLITTGDYVTIPYVISVIPDWWQVATFIVTFIEMVKLIKDAIESVVGYVESAAGAFPVVWEMIVYSALATAASLYAAFLTLLAVNVLEMLINEIIQPIKFKYGMRVRTMFEKAAAYLGLQLSSTILQGSPYKDLVIMPSKQAYFKNITNPDKFLKNILNDNFSRKEYDETQNPLAYGYYDGTFADLIRDMEDVFNAKVLIRDNTLFFERWDFWNNQDTFTLPNVSKEAPFQNPYGTNSFELASNYFIEYEQDTQDTNTIDQVEGYSCQMQLLPNIVNIQKNVLLKNLTRLDLRFAQAKRKVDLTTPEQVVNRVIHELQKLWPLLTFWSNIESQIADFSAKVTSGITDFFDKNNVHLPLSSLPHVINPQLPSSIANTRVGALLLSSDFTSVPKLMVVEENSISVDTTWLGSPSRNIICNHISVSNNIPGSSIPSGYTDTYTLMRDFHSASWAVDKLPFKNYTLGGIIVSPPNISYPNQYLTFKENEIKLCCQDFITLKSNNIIKSFDGKLGRVESLKWNPYNETALIDYKINEVFTKNLQQTIIVDGNISFKP